MLQRFQEGIVCKEPFKVFQTYESGAFWSNKTILVETEPHGLYGGDKEPIDPDQYGWQQKTYGSQYFCPFIFDFWFFMHLFSHFCAALVACKFVDAARTQTCMVFCINFSPETGLKLIQDISFLFCFIFTR